MKTFDLVVIGSGAGLTVLEEGLRLGLSCALVERGKIGGTCLTRGCIPSKILVQPADTIREAERAQKIGLRYLAPEVDWDRISRRMWDKIDESKAMEEDLAAIPNLAVFKGTGEFTREYQLRVELNAGSGRTEEFRGSRFVLATGARSAVPPVPGLEEAGYVTSESFFGEKFPRRPWSSLAIIGGGLIGAEFAHILSAFGTKVILIETLPRLLITEEPEVSALVEKVLRRNLDIRPNSRAVEVRSAGPNKVVVIEDSRTKARSEVEAAEILVAAGRRSNADLLGLDETGVDTDQDGWIKTDEHLETSKPGIWAMGDATGGFQFRHKANADADACVQNIFGPPDSRVAVDYSAVPWAIYTHPQVGHVGMTEEEAVAAGHEILIAVHRYSEIAKGYAMGYEPGDPDDGLVKLVVDRSRRILGAHVVGPHAAVLVQPFVYLMNSGYACPPPGEHAGPGILKNRMACPEAGTFMPIYRSMIIHPSLNEVTGWALGALRPKEKRTSLGPE
jgi:mycothione reductase